MKRFLLNSFMVGACLTFLQFEIAYAQPGTIDATFVPPTNPSGGWVQTTAVQADGKVLIGGSFENLVGPDTKGIARLNADGTLDTSFDPEINGFVTCIRLQADGKILVGGSGFTDSTKILSRLNTDGTLDNTFELDESFFLPNEWVSFSPSFDILPNGKIVAGFVVSNLDVDVGTTPRLFRLNSDGSLDNSFLQIGNGSFSGGIGVVKTLSNGKILVGGSFGNIGGFSAYRRFVLLDANGAPDNDFATMFLISAGAVHAFDVQQDGKFVIGGTFTNVTGYPRNRIARLDANGELEYSNVFGTGFNGDIFDIKVMPNGKMLVLGNFTEYNGVAANRIIMLNEDGTVDSTYDFGTGFPNAPRHVSLVPGGKMIVGGAFYQYNGVSRHMVVRINGECVVDPNVSVSGITITAAQAGATYQWIDCNNNDAPIAGATSQSFTPTANGNYAVVVTLPDCDATSECVAINSVSLDDLDAALMLVFPNPASDVVNIQNIVVGTIITITDVSGRVVHTSTASNDLMTISTQNWSSGLYLIQTALHGAVQQQKLMVSK